MLYENGTAIFQCLGDYEKQGELYLGIWEDGEKSMLGILGLDLYDGVLSQDKGNIRMLETCRRRTKNRKTDHQSWSVVL